MQAVFRLVLEGLAMFAGSWVAGCIPIYVRMNQSRFNLLALFGAGLLIGASLAVILPEGVETLSHSRLAKVKDLDEELESINSTIGWSLVAGFCLMFLIDNLVPGAHSHHGHGDIEEEASKNNDSGTCLPEDVELATRQTSNNDEIEVMDDQNTQQQQQQQPRGLSRSDYTLNNNINSSSPTLSSYLHNDQYENQRRRHTSEWHGHRLNSPQPSGGPIWRRLLYKLGQALSPRTLPSTLIGILVHSCADGLALGAAVASENAKPSSDEGASSTSLEIVVFMALLLHKAPAAFGLITTLKQRGFAMYKLGVWLTMFAASAPLSALFTYAVISVAQKQSQKDHPDNAASSHAWAGTIMMFSAGTFMYVAMAHTLAEAVHQSKSQRSRANKGFGLGLLDIAVLLFGVVLPPLVSKDHDG